MKQTFEIKNRWNGTVIYTSDEVSSIKELVEKAVKDGVDLYGADLEGAYLRYINLEGADLRGANLEGAKNIVSFQCGDYNRISYGVKHDSKVFFQIGCFWGNTDQAIIVIRDKYGENSYYEKLILLYTEMLIEEK
jgi:hypothetical protein